MKFNTDFTKGGYKILSIHGPDDCEEYAGVVDTGGSYLTIMWYDTGSPVSANELYSLIPLADEPEPSEMTELWNEIEALREIVVETLKRMNEMRTDYIERINGLRSDYLTDKDAVSPARVDALEEQIIAAAGTAAFVNRKVGALEGKFEELEKYAYTDHVELMNMALKRIEALEQRSQPSEKGAEIKASSPGALEKVAWVTRKLLVDAYLKTNNVNELAKRLGLEEE